MVWGLVIFDCDGVLVDSEAIANRLVARALTEAGLPMTADDALQEFLGGKLTLIKAGAEQRLGRALPADWVDRVYRQQFEAYRTSLNRICGIGEALDAIDAAGIASCVGSNGPVRKMEVTLGVTGLLPRFADRIFSADDVAAAKPAPDLYLHCARSMGYRPVQCAVVEDSPRGARAGVAAGMTVFGYAAAGERQALREVGCAVVFDDMRALPDLLRTVRPPDERLPAG